MKKLRWTRIIGTSVCIAAIIGGSVFAYDKYIENAAEMQNLQNLQKKSAAYSGEEKVVPPFPLGQDIIQANTEKIRSGDFSGVKAVVFQEGKPPGQIAKESDFELAFWGSGSGYENNQCVRVQLSDSDRAKLDFLAAQHESEGKHAAYEIEFVDNDGHFAILRLVLV